MIKSEGVLDFGKYEGSAKPAYEGLTTESLYLTMRDGVEIAVDVLLPANLPEGTRIPALLHQTRYWRAQEIRAPFKWFQKPYPFQRLFTSHGYALVVVDVRGTGASFGTWPYPWSKDEIMDGSDIVDWIVSQPWSNGKVGAIGVSYMGTTAEFLAVNNHPAVKAVIPRFSEFDLYTDIPFPGGVFNAWFISAWANLDNLLDKNSAKEMLLHISHLLSEAEASFTEDQLPKVFRLLPDPRALRIGRFMVKGVKPVVSDRGPSLLKNAVRAHASNGDVYKLAQKYDFRDDIRMIGDKGLSIDDISVHHFKEEIQSSKVAFYVWGSWFDAANADGVIKRFLTYSNPLRAVIGPWNHGANYHASPYLRVGTSVDPSLEKQWLECLRFLDHHLKDKEDNAMQEKVLIYYTLGEEKWKTTKVWPPEHSTTRRWYFGANNTLSQNAPKTKTGADTYTVDFEATTGKANRWHTQLGFAVVYPDRAKEDSRLLTYTSSSLAEDTEITGYPIVTLHVASTATDGAFFVYLEDVDETAKVRYITEGQLRAIHRKVSTDPPPYTLLVPYHSFKKKDAMTLTPNSVEELAFGLLPTSVLIKKGHRIRIAIAGHDKDTFARIPAEEMPTITVSRNKVHASFVDLPIVQVGS